MTTVADIYNEINAFAPYSLQESYDNSGVNVGEADREVKKILLALDVTAQVSREAAEENFDLVLTHHPVIFKGLKALDTRNPAVILASGGVAAISMHTNFDNAKGGMNDILAERLGLEIVDTLAFEGGHTCGYVCHSEKPLSAKELAQHCKETLGCRVVRFSDSGKKISKIGLCSGAGGDFLGYAEEKKCDALLTGDVKHNVFIDGLNYGVSVIDAGHFYTENIFFDYVTQKLLAKFPQLEIAIAKANCDVVNVV